MYLLKFKKARKTFLPGLLVVLFSSFQPGQMLNAAPVDLPGIIQAPEMKRETMLKDLDIPAVRDRDPDPEAGPRLSITEFRLQGIVEYPELGITRGAISKLVESIRFDMMDEGKLLKSGYTLDELGELSTLLANIEKDVKQRHVGPLEVQRLVWLVRDQMQKRGITLGMIETVADKITTYYRERGFILAKAYIPEQQVRDGVVTLTLLLGVLGETKVNGAENYSDERISSVFDDMLTNPVTSSAVEERLYLLNDFPGLSAQGFFEAGSQVGDTRLNINVKSDEWYNANIRLDNHGTKEVGQNRLYGEFIWNNPTGIADQLQLGVLYSANPDNTTYGQLRYSTNFFSPRLRLSAGIANNDFVVGRGNSESIDTLNIEGETNISDISFSYQMTRSRKENYSFDLMVENIESLIRLMSLPDHGGGVLDDEVRNTSLVFNYDILQESTRMLHQGSARLTKGKFIKGADIGQKDDYSLFIADYYLLSFWQIPFTSIETRSVIRSSIQVSDTALSSINQFSLGGPFRARGFEASKFSADDAFYVGIDWFVNSPDFIDFEMGDTSFNKVFSPFIFIDGAYGRSRSLFEDVSDSKSTLFNAGVGVQFAYSNNMNGSLQFAFPIESKLTSPFEDNAQEEEEKEDMKIIFEFQYSL